MKLTSILKLACFSGLLTALKAFSETAIGEENNFILLSSNLSSK